MIKSFASFSVVPIVSGLITLFVIPLVSHVFPEAEYGKINMFYSVASLLLTFVMLGLDNSQIRFYFEPPEGLNRKSIRTITILVGAVVDAILVAVVLIFFPAQASQFMFDEQNTPLLFCLGVFLLSLIVFRVVNTDARMAGDAKRYNIQAILQNVITKISFVAVGLFVTTRHDASIIAMTIMMLIVSAILVFKNRKGFSLKDSKVTKDSLKCLFAFGMPLMANAFVLYFNGMAGKVVLSSAGLFDDVGVFAIATTISNIFIIIPTAFTTYWSPFMYENYNTKQETIKRIHDLIMWGSAAIVAGIIALQSVLFLIVGGGYASCQAYFMLVMTAPIRALICETTGYGVTLKNKTVYSALTSVACVVLNLVVTIALMGSLGVYGAALGVAVSSFVGGVIKTVVGQHFYKSIYNPLKTLFTSVLIFSACFLNTFICDSVLLQVGAGVSLLVIASVVYFRELKGFIASIKR